MLLLATERKMNVCSVEVCQGNLGKVSLLCQEAPLFRYVQISLPVRGLLGDCYLDIYLFFHVIVFFCIFYLIPKCRKRKLCDSYHHRKWD